MRSPARLPWLLGGSNSRKRRAAQLLAAAEELQRALLNSVSHDLRTPLVSITGALTTLEGDGDGLDDASRRDLITMAREEAERLNRLVGNLLDMTRIEAGALTLARKPIDVQELVSAALERLGGRLEGRPLKVDTPSILVWVDIVLIVQVIVNLLDNALKYSLPGTQVDISSRMTDGWLEIAVSDRGIGVPAEDGALFDVLLRTACRCQRTGLGLAIGKGIVEAHGAVSGPERREVV
jgi:two-component system sensor histidine kinase KdpD